MTQIRLSFLKWFCLVLLTAGISGCALKWNSALQLANDNIPTPQSKTLLAQADTLYQLAIDLESLERSMAAYEKVLSGNPGDYDALVQLSNQYILLGTAYEKSRSDKSTAFQKAMQYAQMAMYTNPAFKDRVASGQPLWKAVEILGKNEVEAMFYWVTALQYEFKEGMSFPSKIRNVNWMARALVFLEQIEKADADFGSGAVEFAKGICYYVLPKSKGGSKQIGRDLVQQAVDKGQKRLLPRWGRAKYYHEVTGNDEKKRADLLWVAAQDLESFEDPYPWRVYFQKDAKDLLSKPQ